MVGKLYTNQVSLWLTDGELHKLDSLVKRAGISRRAYIRHLINGVVPADRPPPDYFKMMRELHSIGNNLNQIAHHAHATGNIDEARYWRNVSNLDDTIDKIMAAVELPQART